MYQATKIGARYLANTLRQEAIGKIRVTIINPTGIPTNLNSTIVDNTNSYGVIGWNMGIAVERYTKAKEGALPAEYSDKENILNTTITAGDLADSIVYAINQPMGVVIGEVTVRSSNELHIL